MRRILCGIETEYGLAVEGRGAEDQIESAKGVVRSHPGRAFIGWDYRFESPRQDLRGYASRLQIDPEDAKFDVGRPHEPDSEVRSDRVLRNGARLYNDHGHPEYSTPECFSIFELARHDRGGETVARNAARAFAEKSGLEVRVYKNNTDFHGASYGTHESYLAPRDLGFDRLYNALTPMLVARVLLCGAGKAGHEHGRACHFQRSQRADFFTERASVDTLYRRPVFNTRDEPHADPAHWIRVHVIATDANRIASVNARKAGLMKLALHLAENGEAPKWDLQDPMRAYEDVSKDLSGPGRIALGRQSWTDAAQILESYFAAAERTLELDDELQWTIESSRAILQGPPEIWDRETDWGAKRFVFEQTGLEPDDPALRSYDLEYANLDPDESLFTALEDMGAIDDRFSEVGDRLEAPVERTRAWVRSIALRRFPDALQQVGWRALTFENEVLDLAPDLLYPEELAEIENLDVWIAAVRAIRPETSGSA